jgi:anti-sigma-K factor RskA
MATEHDELANAIPALVLGSVTAEERQQLMLHLEGCAGCRALAARLARGAAVLPLEPDPVEPPTRLRGRVLAAVAAVRPDAPPRSGPLPIPSLQRRRRLPPPPRGVPLGLAAAAAAFVLGTVAGVGLGHVPLPFGPSSRGQLAGPAAASYPLHGTGAMAGVTADAVVVRRDGLALVDFREMPRPPAGQVYELWLLTGDGRALPAGVFVPDSRGSSVVVLTRDLRGATRLAVTVEHGPDGTSAPSQAPQLSGRIT